MKPYYEHAGITIYHADFRDLVLGSGFFTMITDPPYGIGHASNHGASWNGTEIKGDESVALRDYAIGECGPRPAIVF